MLGERIGQGSGNPLELISPTAAQQAKVAVTDLHRNRLANDAAKWQM